MTNSPEEIRERLNRLTESDVRGRLFARGRARDLIWTDGHLSADAPDFSDDLTNDLIDHGFAILSEAFWLVEDQEHDVEAREAFRNSPRKRKDR